MGENGDLKKSHFVTVNLGNAEGKIEKIFLKGTGQEIIQISSWRQDRQLSQPLKISEKELVTLLQKAVKAGILSPEFLNNLHSEFEI